MASNKNIRIKIIKIFLPILLGGLFYIYFCPDSYISRFININLDNKNKATWNNHIIILFRYYGLDMMWSYSLTCAIMWITGKKKFSLILSVIFSIIIEFLQYFNTRLGTFDIFDIIFEVCSILFAVYFWHDKN